MAHTAPLSWLDGALVSTSEATIPLMAHAPQRGSLVFDVGTFHARASREAGRVLFRADDHVARLLRSSALLGLEVRWTAEELVEAARLVVRACDSDEGFVRWSVFFASEVPDLLPKDPAARVMVAAQIREDVGPPSPVRLAIFDDARKASPAAVPPELKASGVYLGPMLAKRRARAADYDDVLLLDDEGLVAEAPIANFFAVRDGVLVTPPTGKILPGITRDTVITLARAAGIDVREAAMRPSDLADVDEAFLSSSALPLSPVSRLGARALPGCPGPMTQALTQKLLEALGGGGPFGGRWSLSVDAAR